MKAIVLVAVLSSLAGCAVQKPIEGPVRLGQIAFVGGPKVRPEMVIEDSRCPTDGRCVWAGRLIVRVTVLGGGWSRQLDLTRGIPVNVADGTITLVAATPPRRPSRLPLPYRFTFSFQGGL
ncbi:MULTISPECIES: hypothetical protein [Sphingomonadaceae]|jgi:hypothetical protein|uniref:hypothetical protein n=1 Tax=Sphingomonadaceae TaxID=41297 RepID=UPI0009D83FB1|nr:hypothetical protein [Novosphingobium sp. B1]SMD02790.1 hypothetical protein SAMN06272759_12312 [Novosphingobium sp. B1]